MARYFSVFFPPFLEHLLLWVLLISMLSIGTTSNSLRTNFIIRCVNSSYPDPQRCSFGDIKIDLSLKEIDAQAFAHRSINSVDLSNCSHLTTIKRNAFFENQLEEVSLPASLSTIEDHAFQGNNISSIDLASTSILTIGQNAFKSNLLSVVIIPPTVTAISDGAFIDNPIQLACFQGSSKPLLAPNAFPRNVKLLPCQSVSTEKIRELIIRKLPFKDKFSKVFNLSIDDLNFRRGSGDNAIHLSSAATKASGEDSALIGLLVGVAAGMVICVLGLMIAYYCRFCTLCDHVHLLLSYCRRRPAMPNRAAVAIDEEIPETQQITK